MTSTGRLQALTARTPRMLDDLRELVAIESPTDDLAATTRVADAAAQLGQELLGSAPERVLVEGRTHLRWRFGSADRAVVIGHLDTVWPVGTTARWPFTVADGIASGPGTFDMKAGVVQILHGLSTLDSLDGVAVLLTTDEETGSVTSRALIEQTAAGARAALVCEGAGDGGALKTQRKGVSMYELTVAGRAAHAGVEPEKGVNAAVELAHQILAICGIADPGQGTTVTPTRAGAGTTGNTVPDRAALHVDVRAVSAAEQQRVDTALRRLPARLPGAVLSWSGGPNRPPMERVMAAELYTEAARIADDLGIGPVAQIAVGGGSDGNFTAGIGVPTLDGLGPVGGGAHAEGEHVVVAELGSRAALLAGLVAALQDPRSVLGSTSR